MWTTKRAIWPKICSTRVEWHSIGAHRILTAATIKERIRAEHGQIDERLVLFDLVLRTHRHIHIIEREREVTNECKQMTVKLLYVVLRFAAFKCIFDLSTNIKLGFICTTWPLFRFIFIIYSTKSLVSLAWDILNGWYLCGSHKIISLSFSLFHLLWTFIGHLTCFFTNKMMPPPMILTIHHQLPCSHKRKQCFAYMSTAWRICVSILT